MVHHPVAERRRGDDPPLRIMDFKEAVSRRPPLPGSKLVGEPKHLRFPPQPPSLHVWPAGFVAARVGGGAQQIFRRRDGFQGA